MCRCVHNIVRGLFADGIHKVETKILPIHLLGPKIDREKFGAQKRNPICCANSGFNYFSRNPDRPQNQININICPNGLLSGKPTQNRNQCNRLWNINHSNTIWNPQDSEMRLERTNVVFSALEVYARTNPRNNGIWFIFSFDSFVFIFFPREMSVWLLAIRHRIAIDSARSFTKSTNRIPIRVGRLLLLFPWMRVCNFHSILSRPSVRRKWYAMHFDRAIGRQTEAAHDKLNCYQMKRTQHNTSDGEKSERTRRKINWFIFYWNEANVRLAQPLVYTKGPASSTVAYVRANSVPWNREASGVRKRTYAEICVNLCLLCTFRSRLTHTATMTNVHIPTRPRNLLFIPLNSSGSFLAFAHFSSGHSALDMHLSVGIWNDDAQLLLSNAKANNICRTDG